MKILTLTQDAYPRLFRKVLTAVIFFNIFNPCLISIYSLGFRLSFFGVFSSLVFLFTFTLNIILILLLERFLDKETKFGKRQNILIDFYLFFTIFIIITLVFSVVFMSNFFIFRMILTSIFSALALLLAYNSWTQLHKKRKGFIWT